MAQPEPDVFETLYARGVTDGLPVVAPTTARVEAAVEASGRPRDGLVGLVAPKLGRATVEKVAINAVMAGCRPEYMPAVIAAVEAICDPAFALVGVSGTTDTRRQFRRGRLRAGLARQRDHRPRRAAGVAERRRRRSRRH